MQALRAKGSVAYGLIAILLITPLAALVMLQLPLYPPQMALGLAVFATMPTTLSSAVSLTQMAGGNTAMALLLTVTSNMLSVLTLPFIIPAVLARGQHCLGAAAPSHTVLGGNTGSVLEPSQLLVQLCLTVLVPTLAGWLLRSAVRPLGGWVDANRKKMSLINALFLGMVPWMQVSKAVSQNISVSPSCLVCTLAASAALHCTYLAGNSAFIWGFKLGGGEGKSREQVLGLRRALLLCTSQKTLPIAIAIIANLANTVGDAVGVAAIACVISHLLQIIMDSFLVSWWTNISKATSA